MFYRVLSDCHLSPCCYLCLLILGVCVFLFFASKMFGLFLFFYISFAPLFYKLRCLGLASLCISDSGVHFKTLHQLSVLQYSFTVEIISKSNVSSTVYCRRKRTITFSVDGMTKNTVKGNKWAGTAMQRSIFTFIVSFIFKGLNHLWCILLTVNVHLFFFSSYWFSIAQYNHCKKKSWIIKNLWMSENCQSMPAIFKYAHHKCKCKNLKILLIENKMMRNQILGGLLK